MLCAIPLDGSRIVNTNASESTARQSIHLDHAHVLRSKTNPNEITYPVTRQDIELTMDTHEKIYPTTKHVRGTEQGRFRGILCAHCNASEASDFSDKMNEYRASFIDLKTVDTSPGALAKGRKASTLTNNGRY